MSWNCLGLRFLGVLVLGARLPGGMIVLVAGLVVLLDKLLEEFFFGFLVGLITEHEFVVSKFDVCEVVFWLSEFPISAFFLSMFLRAFTLVGGFFCIFPVNSILWSDSKSITSKVTLYHVITSKWKFIHDKKKRCPRVSAKRFFFTNSDFCENYVKIFVKWTFLSASAKWRWYVVMIADSAGEKRNLLNYYLIS